ncbi:MAG TPA: histidine phosphatase family protein, partial [Dongiaceae bacterium]
MALLALLRHGPTIWTAARRLQGRADLPLSPEGR